ncbi:MAG: hypothetical protein RLZZ399_1245, partial [Verrucomicrobiota bacterium]
MLLPFPARMHYDPPFLRGSSPRGLVSPGLRRATPVQRTRNTPLFALKSVLICSLVLLGTSALQAESPLSFNRDIRPILSENCFYCHGMDPRHREAELRLDEREGATRDLGGYSAIVPGKPEDSELVKRLTTHERDDLMPPPKSNRTVSPKQIELIKRWIAQGAPY